MMIKTLDRLNGEGLEILSEKARDCKSVEAIRCISSSGEWKGCESPLFIGNLNVINCDIKAT